MSTDPPRDHSTHSAGSTDAGSLTAGRDYADRLQTLASKRWKQVLDVQRPYRWNLERLSLGRTLDVGCGIGRNLHNLSADSVGVDHNRESIAVARQAGLNALHTDDFRDSGLARAGAFDSILMAHVLEHVSVDVADRMLAEYLPYVRAGGSVVLITPQEAGFRSDATHVRWVDLAASAAHAQRAGLTVEKAYSFPLPRAAGRVFRYNEFVLLARVAS